MLFLHSTADEVVPCSQAVDVMSELKAAGVHAGVSTGDGAGHGSFNRPQW